jgi:hypothetical protein
MREGGVGRIRLATASALVKWFADRGERDLTLQPRYHFLLNHLFYADRLRCADQGPGEPVVLMHEFPALASVASRSTSGNTAWR